MKETYLGITIDRSRDQFLGEDTKRMLRDRYFAEGEESPQESFARAATAYADDSAHAQRIYDYASRQWFMYATPILSNGGTTRGLPISCFVGDTPIITKNGCQNIQDIEKGTLVLTHKGRFRKVLETKASKSSDLFKLVVEKRRTPLMVTGNHLLLTNSGWKRVDELRLGSDFVACDYQLEVEERGHTISLHNKNTSYTQFKRTQLSETVEVDMDLAWALGFWFAEGSTSPNGAIRVTHGTREPCQKWADIMSAHFGSGVAVTATRTWFNGETYSKTLQEFFDSEFGVGCKVKRLPEWVIDLPIALLESLYEGFYLGDGFKTTKTPAFELSNPPLVAGFHNILLRLKSRHSLQLKKKMQSGIFDGLVKVSSKTPQRRPTGVVFYGLEYNPIVSVDRVDGEFEVFDIQVEEDESFSAAGVIAHNCFLSHVGDSRRGLSDHYDQLIWLVSNGGGVGGDWSSVRSDGQSTSSGSKSSGSIPFMKVVDAQMLAFNQGTCYLPGHEILTSNGWVMFEDLTGSEIVAQLDEDGDYSWFQMSPENLVREQYEGEVVEVRCAAGNNQLMVTANHKLALLKDGKLELVRADEADFSAPGYSWVRSAKPPAKTPDLRAVLASIGYVEEFWRNDNWSFLAEPSEYTTDPLGNAFLAPELDAVFESEYEMRSIRCRRHIDTLRTISLEPTGEWAHSYSGLVETNKSESVGTLQAMAALSGRHIQITDGSQIRDADESKGKDYVRLHLSADPLEPLNHFRKISFNYMGPVYCVEVPNKRILVRFGDQVSVCGNTRRGSYAAYSDISHPEIDEFIGMRKPTGGDINRKCLNLNHAVNVTDDFMRIIERCMENPDADDSWDLIDPHSKRVTKTTSARDLWQRIIETRMQTGEPYIHFIDRSNEFLPESQKALGLRVRQSNLCVEIIQATNEIRTAVCCLSSLNLEKWEEWKDDPEFIGDIVRYLDNVLTSFIGHVFSDKSLEALDHLSKTHQSLEQMDTLMSELCRKESNSSAHGLRKAAWSAHCERSLGLGAMGWHAYLQKNNIPFESAIAMAANKRIFAHIKEKAVEQSRILAVERGEPPDMVGTGLRNAHLLAVAPNASSSYICETSPSIELIAANAFVGKTLSGSFLVENKHLKVLLAQKGQDTPEVWKSIMLMDGSVQHLEFLDEWEKMVFKTALEVDQEWVIEHAAARQPYICQSQSLNLFFRPDEEIRYLHDIHFLAWKRGLKTLYYCRSASIKRTENVSVKSERKRIDVSEEGCVACEG